VRLVHGRLFAGGRAQHVFDLRFGGSRVDLTSQVVQADEHGEVLLHSLEPGQRCKVVVCDAMGSEVLAREIVTPALGETLAVDLVVTAVARCIRGRVQSTNEAPLVGATLHLTGGSGRTTDATTDGRGEFVFGDVYDSVPLRIVAVHPGYAAQQRSDLSPHGDSEAIVFRLPPGRNVTVRVVDENGIPGWGDIVLEGDWEDLRLFAPYRRLGPGIKTYFGLPPGMVTFSSWIGDELFGVRHDTAEPEAFLRVPRPARVVAVMPPSWTRPPGHIVVTATRLDPPAEPARQRRRLTLFIPSTRESRETVVVPGRYRFRLEKIVSGTGSEPDRHIPLGMGAEALLPVGELTRVQLR
jgi:hypothetical protein